MLVLATGDAVGEIHDSEDDGLVENYFYTQMVLPMSTFALAIGPWKVVEILPQKELKYICHFTSKTTKVYLSFYYRNIKSISLILPQKDLKYIFHFLRLTCDWLYYLNNICETA